MSEIPSIGKVVRQWREFRRLSVSEFAHQAGLSKGYISEVEHGKISQPKEEQLAKLAAALGISLWDLVTRRLPNDSSLEKEPPQQQTNPEVVTPSFLVTTNHRRRSSALGVPPELLELNSKPDIKSQSMTAGEQIDEMIRNSSLSHEQLDALAEIITSHARKLISLLQLNNKEE